MTPLGRAGRNGERAGFLFSGNQFKGPLPLALVSPSTGYGTNGSGATRSH